eukprot:4138555-Pyramimonas_sp.AAC.1
MRSRMRRGGVVGGWIGWTGAEEIQVGSVISGRRAEFEFTNIALHSPPPKDPGRGGGASDVQGFGEYIRCLPEPYSSIPLSFLSSSSFFPKVTARARISVSPLQEMAALHSWDKVALWDAPKGLGDHGEAIDSLSLQECGETLFGYLVSLKQTGATVHANAIGVIACWATKAGAKGDGALSFGPGKQSGACNERVDSALGTGRKDEQFYMLDVPSLRRADQSMVTLHAPSSPPHVGIQN